jgi:hypothetical protein
MDSYGTKLANDLLSIAARSNRGEFASQSQKETAVSIITELEALNPAYDDAKGKYSLLGSWDLIYTDSQLFLSSPFFLTIRELLGDQSDRAKQIFQLHRAATNTGEIGRVQQIITESELISKVGLRVGILPGQPFSLRGVVVTTAESKIEDRFIQKLKVKNTRIEGSNLPFVGRSGLLNRSLPIQKLFERVKREVPESVLTTYYLDENLRITRNIDDNVFVYSRSPESWSQE